MKRWILAATGVVSIAFLAWLLLRDPTMRTVDYLRLTWPVRGTKPVDLIDSVLIRTGLLGVRPIALTLEPGVVMRLDPNDLVDRTLMSTAAWEAEEFEWIRRRLKPGSIFVDVGAHEGAYSLRAAKLVGPRGRVVAIEPNPPTIRQLKDNIELSGATNISIEEVACGDKEGRITLFVSAARNTGMASLSAKNAEQGGGPSVEVQLRRLDDVLGRYDTARVGFIKIDTEGAETIVLRGAAETLKKYHPPVALEVIPDQLKNMGTSYQELSALLGSLGYRQTASTEFNQLWEARPDF